MFLPHFNRPFFSGITIPSTSHESLLSAYCNSKRNGLLMYSSNNSKRTITTWGGGAMLLIGGTFFVANITMLASTVPAIFGRGAPYLPSFSKSISFIFDEALPATMPDITATNLKKNIVVFDLGSGDGRVVIEAARRGYRAIGYEINPFLVLFSIVNGATTPKKGGSATFFWLDIWKVNDLHTADVIFVYGLAPIMDQLSEKIIREAKPNVIVVSNVFKMPSDQWKLAYTNDEKSVHVYGRATLP